MSNPLIESIRDQLADALERARNHQDIERYTVDVIGQDLSGELSAITLQMAHDSYYAHASARRLGEPKRDFSNSVEYVPALDELYRLLERMGRYMK